jgi:hypothetical protein
MTPTRRPVPLDNARKSGIGVKRYRVSRWQALRLRWIELTRGHQAACRYLLIILFVRKP